MNPGAPFSFLLMCVRLSIFFPYRLNWFASNTCLGLYRFSSVNLVTCAGNAWAATKSADAASTSAVALMCENLLLTLSKQLLPAVNVDSAVTPVPSTPVDSQKVRVQRLCLFRDYISANGSILPVFILYSRVKWLLHLHHSPTTQCVSRFSTCRSTGRKGSTDRHFVFTATPHRGLVHTKHATNSSEFV